MAAGNSTKRDLFRPKGKFMSSTTLTALLMMLCTSTCSIEAFLVVQQWRKASEEKEATICPGKSTRRSCRSVASGRQGGPAATIEYLSMGQARLGRLKLTQAFKYGASQPKLRVSWKARKA